MIYVCRYIDSTYVSLLSLHNIYLYTCAGSPPATHAQACVLYI